MVKKGVTGGVSWGVGVGGDACHTFEFDAFPLPDTGGLMESMTSCGNHCQMITLSGQWGLADGGEDALGSCAPPQGTWTYHHPLCLWRWVGGRSWGWQKCVKSNGLLEAMCNGNGNGNGNGIMAMAMALWQWQWQLQWQWQ